MKVVADMDQAAEKTCRKLGYSVSDPIRLRFGVDYRAGNPYQDLLYAAAGSGVQAKASSVDAALAEVSEEPGQMIYHLHWEDHPVKGVDAAVAAQQAQDLIDGLDALCAAGAQIVWTRHNRAPHDAGHHDIHAALVSELSRIASVIHVHSYAALEDLASYEDVALDKTVVIAHGNYIGQYGDWAAPLARDGFGYGPEEHVFLLFGRLGGYKQVRQTAELFAALKAPQARLLIAGVAAADDLDELPVDGRVRMDAGMVPDDQVGRYFAAADTVLLPYRDCLTSGTGLLAAGFSRGVLGTDVAGLRDVVRPGVSGVLCASDGLGAAMAHAVSEGRAVWHQRGAAARQVARMRYWAGPGRQWRDLFGALARQGRAGDAAQAQIGEP